MRTQKNKYLRIIHDKCVECCCGQTKEVELCTAESCPLYPYRNGIDPYRIKRTLTDEQKEKLRENMKNVRKKKVGAE